MPIILNGTGTISGLTAGGLPNSSITRANIGYSGAVLQVVEANYTTSASTTSVIPMDSTIPQNTEGTEILSASITPTSSSNKLFIQVSLPFIDGSTALLIAGALFQDSTANALAMGIVTPASTGYASDLSFTHYMTAGTTGSTTFKVRYGPHTQTAYINRRYDGTTYGNVAAARLTIMELAA
jgi:hypothetical protein